MKYKDPDRKLNQLMVQLENAEKAYNQYSQGILSDSEKRGNLNAAIIARNWKRVIERVNQQIEDRKAKLKTLKQKKV